MSQSDQHVISDTIKNRYAIKPNEGIKDIAERTGSYVCEKNARVRSYKDQFVKMIGEGKFLPAGNTLVANVKKLQPNCCVIGSIHEGNYEEFKNRCVQLWNNRTGVGFDLSEAKDPVGILKKLSAESANITQWEGRALRGNIAVLSVHHSKLLEFIQCKSNNVEKNIIQMFNISVSIDDAFMKSLASGKDENVKHTWLEIAESAHKCGDPGLIFIDRVQGEHASDEGSIVAPVPCGEQFMHTNETCNLGSINLDAFVRVDPDTGNHWFDFKEYVIIIRLAVRFLDAVVDLLEIEDPIMKQKTLDMRRIGLGLMGLASVFKTLKIPYESEEALVLATQLASALTSTAVDASKSLAREYKEGYKYNANKRNVTVTCIAPTGGIRLLVANEGFSIEPFFDANCMPCPFYAVKLVAAMQKHIENGISKTVNLPSDVSVKRIQKLYTYAYNEGCKGITVYRDTSRGNQPIQLKQYCDGDSCTTH